MKNTRLLLIFLLKISFGTCSINLPTINLGAYDRFNGSSTVISIPQTCTSQSEYGNLWNAGATTISIQME